MQAKKKSKDSQSFLRRFRPASLRNHPLLVPVGATLAMFFVTMAAFVSLGGETIGASDSYVVRLSIDGTHQVMPTRAATVGDLLKRLDIQLREEDIVTPAPDTQILGDNFEIAVQKARPVVIVDGKESRLAYSAQPAAREIAKGAGIDIQPEDKVEMMELPLEAVAAISEGTAAEQVIIQRAKSVNLNLYGAATSVKTHAVTVKELLEEKGIKPAEGDTLQPSPETPLTADTQIFVVRVGHQVETVEEVIAAPVETISDPALPTGTTNVREPGRNGKKLTTYEIELRNGKEVGRKVIQEVLVEESVKRVVVRGTKVTYSNPSANVTLGQEIAASMGWSHEFSCIYTIFQRESGWNHLAINRSSGAYGIPQALPGSKMGPGWESDPAVQIRWGIGYMVNRYGSPCKAQAFWNVNHWY